MTASDLVGRFLLDANGTRWQDGPLAIAARYGAICYLDEVVEARQDTTVVIHPLTDNRRVYRWRKRRADSCMLISKLSFPNPGYQSLMKDLKQSTKQRFGALDFIIPAMILKVKLLPMKPAYPQKCRKTGRLPSARNLKGHGLDEASQPVC